jgi:hypothetical protein
MDNDGDGCVDEEWLDGMDNDGDGLVDEDATLAPFDPTNILFYGKDGIDNNKDGTKDDALERPVYMCGEQPCGLATGDTTSAYLGWTNTPSYFNNPDKDIKLKVAKDGQGTAHPLADRKSLIGGCWVNYNEAMFDEWKVKASNVVWQEEPEI